MVRGNSRRVLRNTKSNASAITPSATSRISAIEPVSVEERSDSTTGAPVTVYLPPWPSRKEGILTAARIHEMAWVCCEGVSDDFRRTWISAERDVGKR